MRSSDGSYYSARFWRLSAKLLISLGLVWNRRLLFVWSTCQAWLRDCALMRPDFFLLREVVLKKGEANVHRIKFRERLRALDYAFCYAHSDSPSLPPSIRTDCTHLSVICELIFVFENAKWKQKVFPGQKISLISLVFISVIFTNNRAQITKYQPTQPMSGMLTHWRRRIKHMASN